jgi:F0F1-type ATP synthase membrane subunit c/vacuolar-type H+-ATPase subunit K
MNGSHIAGTGFGAGLGVAIAALGTRVGLHLDDATSAMVGVGCASAGLAVGHAFGKAWSGIGVFPSIRRGMFGPKGA